MTRFTFDSAFSLIWTFSFWFLLIAFVFLFEFRIRSRYVWYKKTLFKFKLFESNGRKDNRRWGQHFDIDFSQFKMSYVCLNNRHYFIQNQNRNYHLKLIQYSLYSIVHTVLETESQTIIHHQFYSVKYSFWGWDRTNEIPK